MRNENKDTATIIGIVGLLFLMVMVDLPSRAAESESDLAKKTQNPVADLIRIPLQNNMNLGSGPNNRMQNVLKVQPVIPIHLTSEWNLITRTILPIIKEPTLSTTSNNTWGLGATQFSAFLSPAKSEGAIWGVGPILQFPTTTDNRLGSRKWGAGPTAVALAIQGPWVVGILANQVWSYAESSDNPDVSQFLTQYFINFNFGQGWYLTSSPIITSNWEAISGNKWTVPIGGGFGKVFRIGKLPFNANMGYYANVVRPDPGPDGTLRFRSPCSCRLQFSHNEGVTG